MKRLTQDKVMQLHRMMVEATGGSWELRDEGLLNSAVLQAFATFGGEELYPTVEEKGARLGFSLVSNHAFVDGNKRIGVFAMLVFLELNGVKLCLTDQDVIDVGLGVADGRMKYDDLLRWVRAHQE